MSNLIELVLGARMAGGWENEMGWILSDLKFVPTGADQTPKTGDVVLFDAMSNKWALKPVVPVPFTPPVDVAEAEPLEHEATGQEVAYIPGKVAPEPVPDPQLVATLRLLDAVERGNDLLGEAVSLLTKIQTDSDLIQQQTETLPDTLKVVRNHFARE
jgi:hypothetical protein